MKISIVLNEKEIIESRKVCNAFKIPQQQPESYSGKWGYMEYDENHMFIELNPTLIVGIMKIAVHNSTAIKGLANMMKGCVQMYTALVNNISKEVSDLYKNL